MKPHCIDLYCGLGGWAEGFLSEGYDVTGYDIEAHDYGTGGYPGTLILRDIRTIHGSEFKDATCIVGSSPCQKYSYMAMPWSRAKALQAHYSDAAHPERLVELNELFDAQFRIQREASEAAGRHIPMVVENVRGAQKWVGRAKWHHGSFYLWGDVPALMPHTLTAKAPGKNWNEWKDWDGTEENKPSSVRPWGDVTKNDGYGWNENGTLKSSNQMVPDGVKVGGTNLTKVGFNVAAVRKMLHGDPNLSCAEGRKVGNASERTFAERSLRSAENPELDPHNFWHGALSDAKKVMGIGSTTWAEGKGQRNPNDPRNFYSTSPKRKMASAMIAKIPFPLSSHIARCFKPEAK